MAVISERGIIINMWVCMLMLEEALLSLILIAGFIELDQYHSLITSKDFFFFF